MKNSGPSRQPASQQLRSSKTTLPASMVLLATLPLCAVTLVSASALCSRFATLRECPNRTAGRLFAELKKSLTLCRSWALICCSFAAMSLLSRSVELIGTIPGDRIFLVQLADAPQLELDVLSWSRHFRCFPGQGNLPIRDFMQAINATGYKGPLSLEIFNDQFRAQSTKQVAIDGMRSLMLLDNEDAKDKVVPALRSRSNVSGVAFVEFAVDRA